MASAKRTTRSAKISTRENDIKYIFGDEVDCCGEDEETNIAASMMRMRRICDLSAFRF